MLDDSKVFDWLGPALFGAGIGKLIDYILSYKKTKLQNDQIFVETSVKAGENWDRIAKRMEIQLDKALLENDRMRGEIEQLKEELTKLRTYKYFTDAEESEK